MMAYIFDAERNYYSANNVDSDNRRPFGEEIRRSVELETWAKELKDKDKLDVVKVDRDSPHPSQKMIWSRAVIQYRFTDRVKIIFPDDADFYDRYL